jgi:hypothetical protein
VLEVADPGQLHQLAGVAGRSRCGVVAAGELGRNDLVVEPLHQQRRPPQRQALDWRCLLVQVASPTQQAVDLPAADAQP